MDNARGAPLRRFGGVLRICIVPAMLRHVLVCHHGLSAAPVVGRTAPRAGRLPAAYCSGTRSCTPNREKLPLREQKSHGSTRLLEGGIGRILPYNIGDSADVEVA